MHDNCEYFKEKEEHYYGSANHKGTIKKFEVIEYYVDEWIHKILNHSRNGKRVYENLFFIDAMANAGEYLNKHEDKVMGTSLRVLGKYKKYSRKYPNAKMKLSLNDIDKQAIKCQKCRAKKFLTNNINLKCNVLDVSDFLNLITDNIDKLKNTHMLLFYDPYEADIRWDEISKLLSEIKKNSYINSIGVDIIITHFHQNDAKRNVDNEIKNLDVKRKYERTYNINYDDYIKTLRSLDKLDRTKWYRNRIVELINKKLLIDKNNIAYAPVFTDNNVPAYDIVFASHSPKAKLLFKRAMYDKMKDEEVGVQQMSLDFDDAKQELDYVSEKANYKEYDIFYTVRHFGRVVANHFNGQSVRDKDFKEYLEKHPYIPKDGVLKDLKKELTKVHDVKIINGVYNFKNKENY